MSPASSLKPRQNAFDGSVRESKTRILDQLCLKELLAHMNAHTTYPSQFLPVSVQAEPLDLLSNEDSSNGRKSQTLPQLKAKYEFELMHSSAVLYLADSNAVRRFDLQMPE